MSYLVIHKNSSGVKSPSIDENTAADEIENINADENTASDENFNVYDNTATDDNFNEYDNTASDENNDKDGNTAYGNTITDENTVTDENTETGDNINVDENIATVDENTSTDENTNKYGNTSIDNTMTCKNTTTDEHKNTENATSDNVTDENKPTTKTSLCLVNRIISSGDKKLVSRPMEKIRKYLSRSLPDRNELRKTTRTVKIRRKVVNLEEVFLKEIKSKTVIQFNENKNKKRVLQSPELIHKRKRILSDQVDVIDLDRGDEIVDLVSDDEIDVIKKEEAEDDDIEFVEMVVKKERKSSDVLDQSWDCGYSREVQLSGGPRGLHRGDHGPSTGGAAAHGPRGHQRGGGAHGPGARGGPRQVVETMAEQTATKLKGRGLNISVVSVGQIDLVKNVSELEKVTEDMSSTIVGKYYQMREDRWDADDIKTIMRKNVKRVGENIDLILQKMSENN